MDPKPGASLKKKPGAQSSRSLLHSLAETWSSEGRGKPAVSFRQVFVT